MPPDLDQRLRARLKQERERVIGTKAEFASQLGLDPSIVSRWESGDRRLLATELLAVCRVLALTPDQFLRDLVETPIRQLTQPLAPPARRAVLAVVRALDECREASTPMRRRRKAKAARSA